MDGIGRNSTSGSIFIPNLKLLQVVSYLTTHFCDAYTKIGVCFDR